MTLKILILVSKNKLLTKYFSRPDNQKLYLRGKTVAEDTAWSGTF